MRKKHFKKRILPVILTAVMALFPAQGMAAESELAGHWAEKTIAQWQAAGLIKGYVDGTFKPDNTVTRAEFVIMMNNALGFEDTERISFNDVSIGDWYYDAVAKAVAAGCIKGYPDGTFRPDTAITRAEAAVMLANAAGLEADETGTADFTDAYAIPDWAKGSIGAAVGAGFMSGYTDGSFGAAGSITRAKAVSSLDRLMNAPAVEEETEEAVMEDMIITEADTIVENGVINGDLIIDEAVGDGEVYLKDLVVEGDVIINGGGDDSVYFKNVTVKGRIKVNKKDVRLHMSGNTKVPAIEVTAVSQITSEDFTGEIGTIRMIEELGTGRRVIIGVPAEAVIVEGKAYISIESHITAVEICEDAEGAKIEIGKNAAADTVTADAKVNITGRGKIENLKANTSGITVNKNLDIRNIETAAGVSKPQTSGGSTGGRSSGSAKPDTPSSAKAPVTVTAEEVTVTAGTHGTAAITLTGAVCKEELTNAELESISAAGPNAIGWYGFAGTGDTLYAEVDADTAAVGIYTYTVSIPKTVLKIAEGYQMAEDALTVNVTVRVKAKEVTAVTLTDTVADADRNRKLTTKEAAEAYMLQNYDTVTLTVDGKTETADITAWTLENEEALEDVTAITDIPVVLYFTAEYALSDRYALADGVNGEVTAMLNITAAQGETAVTVSSEVYAVDTEHMNISATESGLLTTETTVEEFLENMTVEGEFETFVYADGSDVEQNDEAKEREAYMDPGDLFVIKTTAGEAVLSYAVHVQADVTVTADMHVGDDRIVIRFADGGGYTFTEDISDVFEQAFTVTREDGFVSVTACEVGESFDEVTLTLAETVTEDAEYTVVIGAEYFKPGAVAESSHLEAAGAVRADEETV